MCKKNLDKPMVTVPFHLSYFRLFDSVTITCQVCSVPSATIFDFFRPKQAVPIMTGVKEKFDELVADAKANCPVSKLLNTNITLDAELLS